MYLGSMGLERNGKQFHLWERVEGEKSEGKGSVGKEHLPHKLDHLSSIFRIHIFKKPAMVMRTHLYSWLSQGKMGSTDWKSGVTSFAQHDGKTRENLLQNQVEGENPLPRSCTLTST